MNYLNQEDVTKFAKYRRLIAKAEKWTKEKRELFLKQIAAGFLCPKQGPWVLEVVPSEGSISWKQEFENYLTSEYLQEARFAGDESLARLAAEKFMKELAEKADRKPILKLEVKDNERFSTKKASAA